LTVKVNEYKLYKNTFKHPFQQYNNFAFKKLKMATRARDRGWILHIYMLVVRFSF